VASALAAGVQPSGEGKVVKGTTFANVLVIAQVVYAFNTATER
jgi:hypothetical protein